MSANVEVVSKAKVNLKVTTVAGAGGGGTSDHGALTGLGDDDHPQYQRSDATYTSTSPFTITDESVVITAGSAVTLPDAATMASRLVGVGAAASTVTISPAGTDTMFDDPGNTYSLPAGNGITFVSVQIGGAWGWAIYTRNGPAFDMPKWFGMSLADGSVLKIASGVPAWGAAPAPTAHASSHGSAGSDAITVAQSQVTNLTTDLAGKVPTTRSVSTGTGLSGGGDLSADRTLSLATGGITNTHVSASAAIDASKLSGLAAIATSGSASDLSTGTVGAARLPSLVPVYGTGADGDVTISSGTTTLGGDAYYNNLSISAGATLVTAGYRVFVAGTLSGAGTISNNGGAASGSTAGSAATGNVFGAGGGGGNGGATTGTQPGAVTNRTGGTGAAGGNGSSGNGGAAQTAGNNAAAQGGLTIAYDFLSYSQGRVIGSGTGRMLGGNGGSGGGGDGTAGGGGGGGGGLVYVAARTVTFTGSIEAKGGAGASATAGNRGGGGGGGGGVVVLVTASATNTATLSAAGGAAGSGFGTGTAGGAGGSGTTVAHTGVK